MTDRKVLSRMNEIVASTREVVALVRGTGLAVEALSESVCELARLVVEQQSMLNRIKRGLSLEGLLDD